MDTFEHDVQFDTVIAQVLHYSLQCVHILSTVFLIDISIGQSVRHFPL